MNKELEELLDFCKNNSYEICYINCVNDTKEVIIVDKDSNARFLEYIDGDWE